MKTRTSPSTGPRTGVEVTSAFFPLAFLLFFCTPIVEINGEPKRAQWGVSYFDVLPGHSNISVYFRYVFMPYCGMNSINVNIRPGQIVKIRYYMWPWMFAKGSLREVS